MEKWLSEKMGLEGWVRKCLEFVGGKVGGDLRRLEVGDGAEADGVSLSAGTVAVFMRALRAK